jgi:hypothetical protein
VVGLANVMLAGIVYEPRVHNFDRAKNAALLAQVGGWEVWDYGRVVGVQRLWWDGCRRSNKGHRWG